MNATTVAVDLAKSVFQLAYADANWRVISTARLSRSQFPRCFHNSGISLVIMEACGRAHYWARQIQTLGIEVRLLPARYIRAYVKRNKTDAADAAALLHRPSWLTGPRPHRSTPITSLAVRLPLAAIGTAVLQISISARDTQFPLKMPDIRLQANSCPPTVDQSLLAVGVHIRFVRRDPWPPAS
jgi:hypothetical protein